LKNGHFPADLVDLTLDGWTTNSSLEQPDRGVFADFLERMPPSVVLAGSFAELRAARIFGKVKTLSSVGTGWSGSFCFFVGNEGSEGSLVVESTRDQTSDS